jgi:flagellar hook-basal body complex protein FliE
MANINSLSSVNLRELINNNSKQTPVKETLEGKDFGETISDFIQAVNDKSKESSELVADVIQGKSQNLHEAMASLEESGLSFKLMLEIRNKLLESYKEIQRMQI